MFNQIQQETALQFARKLAERDYPAALALCSGDLGFSTSAEKPGAGFEAIVPLDWGEVDPIELMEIDAFPFSLCRTGGETCIWKRS
jgi:hypothetical protein